MPEKNIYDITAEFIDQFKKEDVILFFEFQFLPESIRHLHGLCKISKPRDKSSLNYISLVFIADTPGLSDRTTVDSVLHNLVRVDAQQIAPGLESIVAIPETSLYKEHLIQQFDLMFKPGLSITPDVISDTLCPAICDICSLKLQDMMPWGDAIKDADRLSPSENPQGITGVFKNIINELKIE